MEGNVSPGTRVGMRVTAPKSWRHRLLVAFAVFGPGLVVMLADTDVGSVITAAQSGAQWGYGLLWLQVILIPILYLVQELTVRLGVHTGKGHGELIRDTFGPVWAWVSVGGLVIACIGAIITEFAGVVGVGQLFGMPAWESLLLAVFTLLAIVFTGSHTRVERAAMLIGAFELAFIAVAIYARPDGSRMAAGFMHIPLRDPAYLYLVAANIGAVIMPWMVFYQQSAVADKGLAPADYRASRWDTAIGAIVTQIIMAAVLVASAATIGRENPGASLDTVGEISHALVPLLGVNVGRVIFALGVLGAAMVAAIVVSLAAAWGLGEVTGYRHSLADRPRHARWFYAVYVLAVVGGAVVVGTVKDLVSLSVAVEVMNALLLPLVLGFLLALAFKALPTGVRLRGAYAWMVTAVVVLTSVLGVYGAITGIVAYLHA